MQLCSEQLQVSYVFKLCNDVIVIHGPLPNHSAVCMVKYTYIYIQVKNIFKQMKKNVGMTGIKVMKQGTHRDVSDDACDVACDHLVIQHYQFTSFLHSTCNVIFVH